MTKREMQIIITAVTNAVVSSLPAMTRAIVREELEIQKQLLESKQIKQIHPAAIQKKTTNRVARSLKEIDLSHFMDEDPKDIYTESRQVKSVLPSTGNKILDELIESTPTEAELVMRSMPSSQAQQQELIPAEELIMSGVAPTVQLAENTDYSNILDMMEKRKGSGSAASMMGVNARAMYRKDPNSIVQQQVVGATKVEKQYKG